MPVPLPGASPTLRGEDLSTTSGKARHLKRCLESVLAAVSGGENGNAINALALQDFRDQFMFWAANMGAMHNPSSKLSLEARLTGTEGVLRHIHGLLDDLFEAVEDVMTLALPRFQTDVDEAAAADNGNPLDQALLDEDQNEEGNDEADDGDDVSSADSLMGEMSDALRGLFRAGVLVRKASARDRFAHALKASRGQFLGQFDIEYAEQKFSKLRRLREESAWLTRRLGNANSKRRQVQKYYRDHKLRLAAGEQTSREEDESRTEKLSSKATTLMPGQLRLQLLQDTLPEDENDAISLTSAVTTFEQGATLKLPRLALLSPDGEPFECPICFVLCACATEKSWKIHAYNDIRPYICTLGGPECEELMFPDRNSWFQHELSEHRSTFVCAICSANGFDTMTKFKDHVLVHGQLAEEQVNDLLAAGRQVQHEFGASACPFCVEWEDARRHRGSGRVTGPQLKRHVATHLEQLALFSVPREVICGPEDSQAGSSGGSGGSVPDMGTISSAVDPSSGFLADLPDAKENETEGIARYRAELAEKERKEREAIEARIKLYMRRLQENLVNAGADKKQIEAVMKKAALEQFKAVAKAGGIIMESGAGNSQDQRESSVIIEADETGPSDALESPERPKMDFGGQQVATAGADDEDHRRLQEDLINSGADEKHIDDGPKDTKGKVPVTYMRRARRHLSIKTPSAFSMHFDPERAGADDEGHRPVTPMHTAR